MKIIENKLWSHLSFEDGEKYFNRDIRRSEAKPVKDYADLVKHIAIVAYHNPELSLFYRGQGGDWRDKGGNSSLFPSMYRPCPNSFILPKKQLQKRFEVLNFAADRLLYEFDLTGKSKLNKFEEIIWAILQHYEVCPTPLLDISSSFRVACSFATMSEGDTGYLYVLGIPHINESISYFTDKELFNIKLQSICPPNALRPYFQDGYLAGTFPVAFHRSSTLNFSRRLIAKFSFKKAEFWSDLFPAIPSDALYPEEDEVKEICENLKHQIVDEFGESYDGDC